MTNELKEKSRSGIPQVQFDNGEVDLAITPQCRSLHSKHCPSKGLIVGFVFLLVTICLGEPKYLCIDVSEGASAQEFPVSEMDKVPDNGWGDEYKTDKIVLLRIPDVEKPFYIGVFEITQRQWELVTGKRPSYYKNENCYAKRPVEKVSYDDIRGKDKGSKYPGSSDVDESSFIGILRAKAKLNMLDLPTRRQWELASREPTGIAVSDPVVITRRGRFGVNPGYYLDPKAASADCAADNGTSEVGSYEPNGRGLYDMEGNVTEWCLDSCDLTDKRITKLGGGIDESHPFGAIRVLKGGNCQMGHCGFHDDYRHYTARRCSDPTGCVKRLDLIGKCCSPSVIYGQSASLNSNNIGLRIVVAQ